MAEGPPPKKARPSSVEDVVLSQAAAAPAGKGAAAAGAKVSGRGMLTLEEVSSPAPLQPPAHSKQDVPCTRLLLHAAVWCVANRHTPGTQASHRANQLTSALTKWVSTCAAFHAPDHRSLGISSRSWQRSTGLKQHEPSPTGRPSLQTLSSRYTGRSLVAATASHHC